MPTPPRAGLGPSMGALPAPLSRDTQRVTLSLTATSSPALPCAPRLQRHCAALSLSSTATCFVANSASFCHLARLQGLL